MDLSFNEEQEILRDSARKFLEKEFNIDRVREYWEDEKGYSEDIYVAIAELGWLALRVPEDFGGLELGLVDLSILFEEMGRVAMTGPFLSTVLATEAIIGGGTDDQKGEYLEGLGYGGIKGTLAVYESDSGHGPSAINLPATKEGDDFVLNGTKMFVLDGLASDLLVVAARTASGDNSADGITLFLVDGDTAGVTRNPLITMDRGRRQCEVVLENVRLPASKILGELDKGWEILDRTLQKGSVLVAMESVGGGQKALDISVAYAKERVQFDQPIGSFQAIKHQCAQGMVEVEGGRSVAYYAAAELDIGSESAAVNASVAKSFCCEAYRNATTRAIQILGAIGLTEEHEMHIYLKRAKMNECLFGDQAYHREMLARLLEY